MINKDWFEAINRIEIPPIDKEYLDKHFIDNPSDLFNGIDITYHVGLIEERYEDLREMINHTLNICFDRIECLSGQQARELLRFIDVTDKVNISSKDLIIAMIEDYDEGKIKKDKIIDVMTRYKLTKY